MNIELQLDAELELKVAARWYEAQQAGLGGAFLDEFARARDRIARSPLYWKHRLTS